MRIKDILDPKCIVLDLAGQTKAEILGRLAASVAAARSDIDEARLLDVLVKREEASSTAIADGIAIPHGKVELGEEVIAALGRNAEGLDFGSVDGQPTQLFFVLVSPENHPSLHLRWLAHIAGLLKDPGFRARLLAAADPKEILAAIEQEERKAAAA